ncbi:MAG TPA: hypothetical protein VH682_14410 [Gemmataceae bacterium]|jgi:hypothetical protein
MSAENDVPLGDGARRYYEQQFGDRIRKVSKGGGSPGRGGSNWNGRAGAGIGLTVGIAFVVLRIFLALARTGSHSPSYTYTPPTQPKFNVDLPKQFHDNPKDVPPPDPFARDLALLLQPVDQVGDPFFTDQDVPFPQGLCYRIQQESQQQHLTPGQRIWKLATPDQRQLIAKTASGQKLSDKEQGDLRETWNAILHNADFYDDDSFVLIGREVATLLVAQAMRDNAEPRDPLFNRLLLEKCYPQQIIPLHKRHQLNGPTRAERRRAAQADFEAARQRYKAAKH